MTFMRRTVITAGVALAGATTLLRRANAQAAARTPVTTLHGRSLPFEMKDGVKEFHLVAGEYTQEFAPGFKVRVWGYNGRSPGQQSRPLRAIGCVFW